MRPVSSIIAAGHAPSLSCGRGQLYIRCATAVVVSSACAASAFGMSARLQFGLATLVSVTRIQTDGLSLVWMSTCMSAADSALSRR